MAGVGHLDIGINQGGAQVFNPMPAIQQYGQILQQQKAKHDAEVKQLGDELAKGYDPSGLRDPDKKAYINKYFNEIKPAAIAAENEKDPTKKAFALADVRKQLNDLGALAEKSKKFATREVQAVHDKMLHPFMYSDDSFDKIKKGFTLSVDDPNIWKETDLERGSDPEKVDANFDKHVSGLLKTAQWQNYQGKEDVVAGKKGQWMYQKKGVPIDGDNGARTLSLHWLSSDLDAQKSLQDRYPDVKGPDQQTTNALRMEKYLNDRGYGKGFYEESKPEFKEARNNELTPGEKNANYHWNLEHNPDGSPKYGTQTNSIPAEPIDNFPIQYNASADNGGFPIHAKNFVPLSTANKEFAGSADIDVTNGGRPTGDAATIKGMVAGVGDFPVYKSGKLAGTPAQGQGGGDNIKYRRMVLIENKDADGNARQYLLDYDKLPANVRNSKEIKGALGKFEKTPVGGQRVTTQQGAGKTVSMDKIKS